MTDQTAAEQRGQQALAALADEDAEVEAAATDRLLDDIAKLDAEGATMAEHDWDGLG